MKRIIGLALVAGVAVAGCSGAQASEPKVVTRQVVPQACLDALDRADVGFVVASEAFGVIGEAMNAVIDQDAAGIEAATSKLAGANAKLADNAPKFVAAKTKCRAAAEHILSADSWSSPSGSSWGA